MKKILIAALVILMCFAFIGCGGEEEEDVVLNPDADIEGMTDTDWAKDIWNSAIQDLVDKGYAKRSEEEGILDKKLVSTVLDLYRNREKYIEAMAGAGQQESIPTIMGLLNDLADK